MVLWGGAPFGILQVPAQKPMLQRGEPQFMERLDFICLIIARKVLGAGVDRRVIWIAKPTNVMHTNKSPMLDREQVHSLMLHGQYSQHRLAQ